MKQVDPAVIDYLSETAKKYPAISALKLFGSRARGDANDRSDYDVALYSEGNDSMARFKLEVSENLPTLCGIDLVEVHEEMDPKFLRRIEAEGIVIYTKSS